jgi:hypothetical protein
MRMLHNEMILATLLGPSAFERTARNPSVYFANRSDTVKQQVATQNSINYYGLVITI